MAMRKRKTSKCYHCDVEFTGSRKYCTKRCEKMLLAKQKGVTGFRKVVATLFQKMIRAEYAAMPDGYSQAINKSGNLIHVYRKRGWCVCVTCGKLLPWTTSKGLMQTGHFIASRAASILFDEDNVAPQCSWCNGDRNGAASEYRAWMIVVRGIDTIERLERQRHMNITQDRDELVDMWFAYSARLANALKTMKGK